MIYMTQPAPTPRAKTPLQRFARFYTPAVVALAVAAMAVGLLVDASRWRDWLYMALVVLVTACPCALVISTPVASVSGLARAAKQVGARPGRRCACELWCRLQGRVCRCLGSTPPPRAAPPGALPPDATRAHMLTRRPPPRPTVAPKPPRAC